MNKFYNETLSKLETTINEIELEAERSILAYESAVEYIVKTLSEVKDFVIERGFKSVDEEINFFKCMKPSIVSKLIYYNAIYKIETKKPYGEKPVRKYLNNELKKLKKYFDNNLEFYKYYRTNSSYLDHKYFLRGKHDIKLSLDTYYFQSDHTFSTSHDYKVAKIIANDLIQVYIEDQLNSMDKHPSAMPLDKEGITWTGTKAGLTELIYALHYQAVFDNGNTDIRIIAQYFETVFNVDLGDFYHTYLEIKNRKNSRTKFLDNLRDGLSGRMDDQDE